MDDTEWFMLVGLGAVVAGAIVAVFVAWVVGKYIRWGGK
jgi:hypothetical protein